GDSGGARRREPAGGVRGLLAERAGQEGIRHERHASHPADPRRTPMLTMLEEVVLLAVDERTGGGRSTPEVGTAYALVGGLFFDLALARRIDTDTEAIHIVDRTPTGNATLDRVLDRMAARPALRTVRDWIEEIFLARHDLEGEALASLIAQGILR